MFNSINYNCFSSNSKRAGFRSVKREKSQRYLVVKPDEPKQESNFECDFDNFTAISFDEEPHLEYNDMFPEKPEEKVFENDLEKKEEPATVNLDVNNEILKMKTMTSFLQNINIQKAKKQSQKYERK